MIKINSRQEILDLGTVWFDEPNAIRIGEYGIFHLKDNHYPKYFHIFRSYDTRFYGDFYECSQEEYKDFLKKTIDKYLEEIKKLQKMLDNEI